MTEEYRQTLMHELECQANYNPTDKDILVVVHNQQELFTKCLESVKTNTDRYKLLVHDNGSSPKIQDQFWHFQRSEKNLGYIIPNNQLALHSRSPFIILLNSDVVVLPGWDTAMIGWLQCHPDCGIVGYQGGLLNKNGEGRPSYGAIDYVSGWCMCFSASLYQKIGLFDESLQFAYGEDSDFCLRAKSVGYKPYALHLAYTQHVGSATIKEVTKTKDLRKSFEHNHNYLKNKWKDYSWLGKK